MWWIFIPIVIIGGTAITYFWDDIVNKFISWLNSRGLKVSSVRRAIAIFDKINVSMQRMVRITLKLELKNNYRPQTVETLYYSIDEIDDPDVINELMRRNTVTYTVKL